MSIITKNTLLKRTESEVERSLAPKIREGYLKIVVSGMKVALNGGDKSPFAKMVATTKDPIRDSVNGAIGLVMHMRSAAKGVMPLGAMIPAAMTLMFQALDLVEKAGLVKIGKPELAAATKMFMPTMFKQFGITKDQLVNAVGKANALVKDPAHLEAMQIAGGLKPAPGVRDVRAAIGGGNGV